LPNLYEPIVTNDRSTAAEHCSVTATGTPVRIERSGDASAPEPQFVVDANSNDENVRTGVRTNPSYSIKKTAAHQHQHQHQSGTIGSQVAAELTKKLLLISEIGLRPEPAFVREQLIVVQGWLDRGMDPEEIEWSAKRQMERRKNSSSPLDPIRTVGYFGRELDKLYEPLLKAAGGAA